VDAKALRFADAIDHIGEVRRTRTRQHGHGTANFIENNLEQSHALLGGKLVHLARKTGKDNAAHARGTRELHDAPHRRPVNLSV
jgi:hypothetical protein